jgi:hypothetical protein
MSAVTQQQQQGPGARRVTLEQIAAVQTMIERCMQLYMAKDEVMACLKDQANIEVSWYLWGCTHALPRSARLQCTVQGYLVVNADEVQHPASDYGSTVTVHAYRSAFCMQLQSAAALLLWCVLHMLTCTLR